MGASVFSRRRGHRKLQPMSEINMVPMIDVMLVLLIIFMISAPLLTAGIEVELPKTQAKPLSKSEEPLVITINKDGTIYLQETKMEGDQLLPRLKAITQNNYEAKLYIKGDKNLSYGRIMAVMGDLSQAGFVSIALVAERP